MSCTPVAYVSDHAVQQYRKRSGSTKTDTTIRNRIRKLSESRVRVSGQRWYALGWILAIAQDEVVTVFKPRGRKMRGMVCDTMRPLHQTQP